VGVMDSSILSGNGMTVIQAQLGEWDNLNHLLVCEKTGEACIVDPLSGEHWLTTCKEHGWNLKSALLTHSHWDHTMGVQALFDAGVEMKKNAGGMAQILIVSLTLHYHLLPSTLES
jgi:glyoxylase-like metal-dependent hydrolase (beta-lactamase superfamily II)